MRKPTPRAAKPKAPTPPPPAPTPPAPPKPFDLAKNRLILAINEVNEALKQAHEVAEMRVFIRLTDGEPPIRFHHEIYTLVAASFDMNITYVDEVKHADWTIAAGEGLNGTWSKVKVEKP